MEWRKSNRIFYENKWSSSHTKCFWNEIKPNWDINELLIEKCAALRVNIYPTTSFRDELWWNTKTYIELKVFRASWSVVFFFCFWFIFLCIFVSLALFWLQKIDGITYLLVYIRIAISHPVCDSFPFFIPIHPLRLNRRWHISWDDIIIFQPTRCNWCHQRQKINRFECMLKLRRGLPAFFLSLSFLHLNFVAK